MNTLEMIKAASENPGVAYVHHGEHGILMKFYLNVEGLFEFEAYNKAGKRIPFENMSGSFTGSVSPNDEWEVERNPVPWQEAIEAWVKENKRITVIMPDNSFYTLSPRGEGGSKEFWFRYEEFVDGKWFIE